MHKILLYGPTLKPVKGAYGGGTGGYTRKMKLYLQHFRHPEFQLVPCFHTVRGEYSWGGMPLRMLIDVYRFFFSLLRYRPAAVHILGQYRGATPREFAIVWISRLFRIPIVYEIKAGVFHHWHPTANKWYQRMINFVLKRSDRILCQGTPYMEYIKKELGRETFFHPNFIPNEAIIPQARTRLQEEEIKVLFVGYAYKDKGVFEMVNALNQLPENISLQLTFVGKESDDFKQFLDQLSLRKNLKLNRAGLLSHDEVMPFYESHDIYLYPTYHGGEGHNNSINEAMMMGLVIISTRQGFLGGILNEEIAYFLPEVTEAEIQKTLIQVAENRAEAAEKGLAAHEFLKANYTSEMAFKRLESHYHAVTN